MMSLMYVFMVVSLDDFDNAEAVKRAKVETKTNAVVFFAICCGANAIVLDVNDDTFKHTLAVVEGHANLLADCKVVHDVTFLLS